MELSFHTPLFGAQIVSHISSADAIGGFDKEKCFGRFVCCYPEQLGKMLQNSSEIMIDIHKITVGKLCRNTNPLLRSEKGKIITAALLK